MKFGVLVQDRWSNRSDTLIKTLKPIFERRIPKSLFQKLTLPGDTWQSTQPRYFLELVWDDIEYNNSNIFAVGSMGFPGWFTIDMGQDVLLSRMQMFQRLLLPYCRSEERRVGKECV